jgi:hypothetical protein
MQMCYQDVVIIDSGSIQKRDKSLSGKETFILTYHGKDLDLEDTIGDLVRLFGLKENDTFTIRPKIGMNVNTPASNRELVFAEAELLLKKFPEFFAVDENIYHLYGVVFKDENRKLTVEINIPENFPLSAPSLKICKEIHDLLGNDTQIDQLTRWEPNSTKLVDIINELKMKIMNAIIIKKEKKGLFSKIRLNRPI